MNIRMKQLGVSGFRTRARATAVAAVLTIGGLGTGTASAAILLTDAGGGVESSLYTQDFNSLPNGGADGSILTWTDNSTLPGWYARNGNTTSANYRKSAGGVNAYGRLFSFGAASGGTASDRALGPVSSAVAANRPAEIGVAFQNDTGLEITELIVGYTAEQWRRSTNGNTLTFQYSLDATSLFNGTWTGVAALNSSTLSTGSNAALDGNNAANRTVIAPVTISGLSIAHGETVWLRWTTSTNNDLHGHLGVDDFSLKATLVPEPASLVLLAAGSLLIGLRRREREVTA